jgi:hypothetical protein
LNHFHGSLWLEENGAQLSWNHSFIPQPGPGRVSVSTFQSSKLTIPDLASLEG